MFSKYGGIELYDNKIFYVSGESDFFLMEENESKDGYVFNQLKISKINNYKEEFIKKNEKTLSKRAQDLFGVKDVLINNFKYTKNKIILISSLNYLKQDNCYNLSLYKAEIINAKLFEIDKWNKIFSTKDCLSITLTQKPNFAASSAGGRIFKLDNDNILLTVGDFYSDGKNGPILSQDLKNDYGKILKINVIDGSYSIYSFGHRNPQGLFIDKKNNIFSTEHGPQYGDEVNLISKGGNFGWPYATFGTAFRQDWPFDKTNNTHQGYKKPIFSFGNTIGISNLIVYEGDYFSKWNNNLIISSLAGKKLIRMVFDHDSKSIIYIENIPIRRRIRDIIKYKNGTLALLTDRGWNKEFPEIILIQKFE